MKALCVNGGGVRGSYHAGVISHLMGRLGMNYDIFTGTSVGAINAGYLAQFRDPREAGKGLADLWLRLRAEDIYRLWCYGCLGYLPALWKGSLYDSQPLRDFITKNFDGTKVVRSGKKLRISAVTAGSGSTRMWDELNTDLVSVIMASSAFPGVFPCVKMDGVDYMDGGVREVTPLGAAIEAGATEIDVISCTVPGDATRKAPTSTLGRVVSAIEVMTDEIEKGDLLAADHWNLAVSAGVAPPGKRHVKLRVIQLTKSEAAHPFDFRRQVMDSLFAHGVETAIEFAETHGIESA